MRGEFCVIAPDVILGRDVAIYNFVNLYGCEIGDETRIGTGAVILGGLEIGARAIIGAGAVVTRSVPPGAIVAGNPAKLIRVMNNE